ncbi:HupE/UreJ family protein [Kaarinaea lacus]
MNRLILALSVYVLVGVLPPLHAHEVRPGYLYITEIEIGQYDVLWKVPARGNLVLSITPSFTPECKQLVPPSTRMADGAQLTRWTMDCGDKGLDGVAVAINGLVTTMIDVLVRIEFVNGVVVSRILRPNDVSFTVNASGSNVPVLGYITLGIEHILLGIDHLLFVLGLLLIVRGKWLLIKTITSFTIAHSITLAMATLGFVNVPQAPVEAVIALSILFLATELVKQQEHRASLTERYPWIVAFIFGLLHGFGFAGALTEVGLPQNDIPLALLFFNVGVEIGQLIFVAAVLSLSWAISRVQIKWPLWIKEIPAYTIGSVAAFWCIERIVSFW